VRDHVDAILIGIGTALADDPSLTARIRGEVAKDPIRVVLDTNLRLSQKSKLLQQKSNARTIIYCGDHVTEDQCVPFEGSNVDIERVSLGSDGQIDLKMVLESLAKRQVTSILVEGGSQVHASFVQNSLADQAMLFYGPMFIGDQGVPLLSNYGKRVDEKFSKLTHITTRQFGNDVLIEGLFE
jgi:diaminohydroxyphosphoribosylaminopyrimidine deaminase/5-amino-6-(5-phosphoribosylamino)uracil reductase